MVDDSSVLLSRASAGDGDAIEAIITRHIPALRAYIRLRMGPVLSERESASDLVQSTCRELLNNCDSDDLAGERVFKKWLFTAALHKIQQHVRYHASQKRTPAREASPRTSGTTAGDPGLSHCYADVCTPSRIAMGREDLHRVEQAFEKLPEDHREVILSARLLGLSHQEIAEKMGRSEGAVRVLLHRALARLATVLTIGVDS